MKPQIIVGLICFCLVASIVIIVPCIVKSIGRLQTHEVGVMYDTIWKKLGKDVYHEGVHFGPVSFEWIKFSSIFQSIRFMDLTAISKDGASVRLDISYQFRVRPQQMRNILMEFRDLLHFVDFLQIIGQAVVQDSVAIFDTAQLMSARAEFMDKVRSEVTLQHGKMHCDIADIQVENIRLPNDYEASVRQKEAARENIEVARSEEPRLITQALTEKREAETVAAITLDRANTNARIRLTEAGHEADAITHQFLKDTQSLVNIKSDLGLTTGGLISYMTSRAIARNQHSVYVGLPAPANSGLRK